VILDTSSPPWRVIGMVTVAGTPPVRARATRADVYPLVAISNLSPDRRRGQPLDFDAIRAARTIDWCRGRTRHHG